MNTPLVIATLALGAAIFAKGQNVAEEPKSDAVLEAIQEFNNRDKSKPNEVIVVLTPFAEPPAPAPVAETKPPAPVVTTDKTPPETASIKVSEPAPALPPEASAITPDEASPKPENGLAVRVEKLQTGNASVNPSKVKLLAPFPAKPLAQPPAGWRLDASDTAPPFTREVELSPGSKITLSIRPHLLIPDADGAQVFAISEPGYDNRLGYQQTATVAAILSKSVAQLDKDSKELGNVIDSLQQLLVSLPKPEAPPKPELPVEIKPAPIRRK